MDEPDRRCSFARGPGNSPDRSMSDITGDEDTRDRRFQGKWIAIHVPAFERTQIEAGKDKTLFIQLDQIG
jgi:hypothetical protein